MTPDDFKNPLKEYFWPAFREGRVALSDGYGDAGGPATNFGLALGLLPKLSLFPLLVGFIVGTTGLLISLRQPRIAQMGDTPSPTGDTSEALPSPAEAAAAAQPCGDGPVGDGEERDAGQSYRIG
jgi:hypothetical protein